MKVGRFCFVKEHFRCCFSFVFEVIYNSKFISTVGYIVVKVNRIRDILEMLQRTLTSCARLQRTGSAWVDVGAFWWFLRACRSINGTAVLKIFDPQPAYSLLLYASQVRAVTVRTRTRAPLMGKFCRVSQKFVS